MSTNSELVTTERPGIVDPRRPIHSWPELRDRLRREVKVLRSDDDRLLLDYSPPGGGHCVVRVQRAVADDGPAVELSLLISTASSFPPAILAAANDNVVLGEIRVANGSAILQHTLPLDGIPFARVMGTMASLVGEVNRITWMMRPFAAASRLFQHFSD